MCVCARAATLDPVLSAFFVTSAELRRQDNSKFSLSRCSQRKLPKNVEMRKKTDTTKKNNNNNPVHMLMTFRTLTHAGKEKILEHIDEPGVQYSKLAVQPQPSLTMMSNNWNNCLSLGVVWIRLGRMGMGWGPGCLRFWLVSRARAHAGQ